MLLLFYQVIPGMALQKIIGGNKMKHKNLLALLLVLVMIVSSLAGCSSKKETEETKADETKTEETKTEDTKTEDTKTEEATSDGGWEYKEASITLSIDKDVSLAGLEAVVALAKEKLDITVEIETRVSGAEGDAMVKTRLASGDMTDICGYNSGSLLNALNPTEYFMDISSEEFIARLDDTYKKTVTVGDATFGVPFSSSQAGAILYSKPMYEKYGLEVPKTWSEFIANCEVLKTAEETAIIGTYADSWTAQVLYLGDNYNVLAAEPDFAKEFEAGTAKYATTPAGLASFAKLAETNKYYNEDYLAASYDDGCDMIANGEGAHWIMLTQALSNIYGLYGELVNDIGVFAIPGDDANNSGLTVWMPTSLYGNKASDKQEDILRFMEFYVSDEALDAYTSAVLPDGPYCIKGYELPDNSYEAVVNDMQAYFDAGKTAVALEFLTAVKGANCPAICQEVASGQTNAEEAAASYDDDCLKQAVQLGLDWK